MKIKFFVFSLVFILMISQLSCSTVEQSESVVYPSWDEVETKYASLESSNDFNGIEEYAKELLGMEWAIWQKKHLKFWLASALYRLEKYEDALGIFRELGDTAPFTHRIHLMAGESELALKNYDSALKQVLSIYLKLEKEEKIGASKTVFLSYLYSKRIDIAARWYMQLDDTKKANTQKELDAWLAQSDRNRRDWNDALNGHSETPAEAAPKTSPEAANDELQQETAPEDAAQDEVGPEDPATADETAVIPHITAAAVFDPNYVPDWKKLCVVLSEGEKWSKFNEVIKTYVSWHISKYGAGINIEFIQYSDDAEVDAAMKKARESGCFAVLGPLFAPEFAETFIEKSAEYSLPVVSYMPFVSSSPSLLFNIMPTKDVEAENILKYAVSERGKQRFAIAYTDDFHGRELRDLYWKNIEALGGKVTATIDISPADNAFLDDVSKVVDKPENYDEAIRTFKWRNKEKYTTDALMRRAVDGFVKGIPGRCDFDALVVLTSSDQAAALLPSFPYLNVEFEYYQKYLNRSVAAKNQNIKKSGFDWTIQQILVLGPADIVSNAKAVEKLDKLIDGMVVYAPQSDKSDKNAKYTELVKTFKAKNEREPYFVETLIAETLDVLLTAYHASDKANIGSFAETLRSAEYTSLLSGTPTKFDGKNRMTGRSAIMIARNKEPFMTPEQIIEDMNRKAEEQKKQKEEKAKEQENETSEN